MKPIRTPDTNTVFKLPGGTVDNDLPIERDLPQGALTPGYKITNVSTWELDDNEREIIASGGHVELCVWGSEHPPVSLAVMYPKIVQPAVDFPNG